MTDPIAYIEGQLDVYDVIALVDAEAAQAATAVLTEDEDEYLATCPGYLAHEADEVTWDEHEVEDNGFECYPVDEFED